MNNVPQIFSLPMPSPNTSAQNSVFIESVTESESDFYERITDPESDPDERYPIENQLGLPIYHNIFIESSPPPIDVESSPPPVDVESSPPPVDVNVDDHVDRDELNNEGEFFFSKKGLKRLSFRLAEAACRLQDDQDGGIDSGVGAITDIVLSSDDKVRSISSFWCCLQK